jgi:hypothetical protein
LASGWKQGYEELISKDKTQPAGVEKLAGSRQSRRNGAAGRKNPSAPQQSDPPEGDEVTKLQGPWTPGAATSYSLTSKLDDVLGLESFSALGHLELNRLVFLERLKPLPLDGGMMHKDIGTVFLGNKAITLRIIKPLYRTLHFHAESNLLKIAT